jgi:hypothetical protein
LSFPTEIAADIDAKDVLERVRTIIRFVEGLPGSKREEMLSLLSGEACDYWHEHELQQFDATHPSDDSQAYFRYRAHAVEDAVQCTLMQSIGISPERYELFSAKPTVLWEEMEERAMRLVASHTDYIYEMARRVRLAREQTTDKA